MGQKRSWRYIAFSQTRLAEGKIVPIVFFPHKANITQPFNIFKIHEDNVYFAIRGKRLLEICCP